MGQLSAEIGSADAIDFTGRRASTPISALEVEGKNPFNKPLRLAP